jgi:uncharacterized protein YecT (DUF1311 family)
MTRPGGDDADYVLIYDGENGLRMAPRAAALGFEDQDPGHLDVGAPAALAPTRGPVSPRGAQVAAVIGVVIAVSLLGFLLGRLPGPAATSRARVAIPAATAIPPAPVPVLRGGPRAARPAPARHLEVARRPAAHRPAAAIHRTAAIHKAATGRCATVRGWTNHLVCRDPQLAAQDARLAQALASAAKAGVPVDDLQDGQATWLAQRNAAAHRSRAEVSSAYRQRIEEVESLANQAPPF